MSIYGGGQGSVHPTVVQALLQALAGGRQYRPADMQHALGNDHEAAALWFQHHPGAMQGNASGIPSYVHGQAEHQQFPGGGGSMPNARQKLLQILMQRQQGQMQPQQPGGPAYGGPFDR